MKQKTLSVRALGFTLIELLVVIAIIGVLAAVVLINLNASRAQARDGKRIADLKEVQKALAIYYIDCNQYPATLDPTASDGCTAPMTLADFLQVIPVNPVPGGIDYVYTYDDVNNTYTIDFALEGQNDQLAPGAHTMTPNGFQ